MERVYTTIEGTHTLSVNDAELRLYTVAPAMAALLRELMAVINSVDPRAFTTDNGKPESAEYVYRKAEQLLKDLEG